MVAIIFIAILSVLPTCYHLVHIFGPTFLISLFICYILNRHIFFYGNHYYIGKVLCLYFVYRFLCLAFSDPGLARLRQAEQPCDAGARWRFCDICRVNMRKFTRHCDICDVCVEGYDHHCIFVGKCIGKGNMGQFKDFLLMAFGTMIYALILSVSIATEVRKVNQWV